MHKTYKKNSYHYKQIIYKILKIDCKIKSIIKYIYSYNTMFKTFIAIILELIYNKIERFKY